MARRFTPSRRRTTWSDIVVRSEIQGLGSTQAAGDSALGVSPISGLTLLRSRGSIVVHMVADVASASMVVGCGLGVFNTDAFTIGATALPSPIDDIGFSWIWHKFFVLGPSIAAEAAAAEEILTTVRDDLDSKAQRVIGGDQTIGFMWDAFVLSGSPTADANVAVRQLFMHG